MAAPHASRAPRIFCHDDGRDRPLLAAAGHEHVEQRLTVAHPPMVSETRSSRLSVARCAIEGKADAECPSGTECFYGFCARADRTKCTTALACADQPDCRAVSGCKGCSGECDPAWDHSICLARGTATSRRSRPASSRRGASGRRAPARATPHVRGEQCAMQLVRVVHALAVHRDAAACKTLSVDTCTSVGGGSVQRASYL